MSRVQSAGYVGDFALGQTFTFHFFTFDVTGAGITLAATPSLEMYADSSTLKMASGLGLSVDYATNRVGLHLVTVTATAGASFAAGSSYTVAIATGTVDSVGVIGRPVGWFTLGRSVMAQAAFDQVVNAVWATPARALGTAGQTAVSQETTNAVWATPTRALTDWAGIVNAVWATPTRALGTAGRAEVVSSVWATPTRTLSAWSDIVNEVWATPTRTVTAGTITTVTGNVNVGTTSVIDVASGVWDRTRGSHNAANSFGNLLQSFGVTVATNSDKTSYTLTQAGYDQIVNAVWATSTRALGTAGRAEVVSSVWATPTRTLSDWGDIVNAVWATPTRVTTSVASPVGVGSNFDKTNYTLTAAAATAIADSVLDRDMALGIDSGSASVRTVRQGLRALRNKVDLLGGVVYKEDDSTTSWTFVVASDTSSDRVIRIDPA